MKKLILIPTILLVTACNTPPVVKETSRVQTLQEAQTTLNAHIEKARMNQDFCAGKGFDYYSETATSYSFRCKSYVDDRGVYVGGGYFHLVK